MPCTFCEWISILVYIYICVCVCVCVYMYYFILFIYLYFVVIISQPNRFQKISIKSYNQRSIDIRREAKLVARVSAGLPDPGPLSLGSLANPVRPSGFVARTTTALGKRVLQSTHRLAVAVHSRCRCSSQSLQGIAKWRRRREA